MGRHGKAHALNSLAAHMCKPLYVPSSLAILRSHMTINKK